LIAGYSCYLLAILLVIIYECYANIVALHQEIDLFRADDFSRVMGRTQKILVVAMASCNQLNMLLNFRRLARIYEDIADLEKDINNSLPGFSVRGHWWSFRYRIAIFVGLWIVLLVGLTPRFTLVGLGPFLHWTNKVLTELVLIMTQLKSAEYCVFVLLIYELILRLRLMAKVTKNKTRGSLTERWAKRIRIRMCRWMWMWMWMDVEEVQRTH